MCIGVRHHANFHCCDKNKQVWGAESEGPRVTARSTDNGGGVEEGGGALEGGEAGWRGGMGRGEVGDGEWGLTLNYLDPARQPHITVTSLFGKGLMGLWR